MTIDWTNATREPSGYPDSLGDVETLKFGRVAHVSLPMVDNGHAWVRAWTPVGPRLGKKDKIRLGRGILEVSGRKDLNDKWTDNEVVEAFTGRMYTQDSLTLKRYPNPAESHARLKDDVSYNTPTSGGSAPKEQILFIPN